MDRAVRIYVTVAAMTAMLIGPAFSQEAGQQLPAPLTESTVTDSSAYPYKWQRRLLAAQVAFANSLVGTDLIETGAINPQEK